MAIMDPNNKAIPAINPVAGTFTGNSLILDPVTGFLTSPESHDIARADNGQGRVGAGIGPLSVFSSKKKVEFLSFLMENFPNYSECAKKCGVTRATVMNHYNVDKKFKACVDEIKDIFVDRIEEKRFQLSIQDKGGLDRMAVLNAYRRETYNPNIQVEVNHSLSPQDSQKRFDNLHNVIDTTVVDRVKEIRRENKKNAD